MASVDWRGGQESLKEKGGVMTRAVRRSLGGLTLMTLGLGAWGLGGEPPVGKSREYRDGHALGRQEAELQLKQGKPTIYTFGLRSSGDDLDRETGLVYQAIAGCLVSDGIIGRADGHNERLREELAAKGTLPGSFKGHEEALMHLASYAKKAEASQDASARPVTLETGGPERVSPDGRFGVRLVPAEEGRVVSPVKMARVAIRDGSGKPEPTWAYVPVVPGQPAQLVWGPNRSGFAVLFALANDTNGARVVYQALDLYRGRVLRVE